MEDLSRQGWKDKQAMPSDSKGLLQWDKARSDYFRFRYLEKVIDLRNEFAQLHLRDSDLDSLLESAQSGRDIVAMEIEQVSDELRALAGRIK